MVTLIHAWVECAVENFAAAAVAGAAGKDEDYAAAVEVGAVEEVGLCTYLDPRPESDNFPYLLVVALAGFEEEASPVEVQMGDCSVEV